MKLEKGLAAALLAMLLVCSPLSAAAEKNIVGRMGETELETLMSRSEGPHLVVAMASWCTPCRKELPALNRLYEKYRGKGLKVVGISLDAEGPRAMQPIIDKLKIRFPVYWVGEGAMKKYDIFAVPTLFFIKDGKTAGRVVGKRSEKFLDQKIGTFLD
jgi:thiol-disulfide isomerase/thioredoxin